MGVVLFGAVYWALGYAVLMNFLDGTTLQRLFIFGALSIPAIALIKIGSTIVLQRLFPVGVEKLYSQSLKVNAAIKLLFVILLYCFVAEHSPKPRLTLVAGAALFTLALPEHFFRLWTYKEAPDRYNLFILHHSSLVARFVMVGLALLLVILRMKSE